MVLRDGSHLAAGAGWQPAGANEHVRPARAGRWAIHNYPKAIGGKASCQDNRNDLLCHINLKALGSFKGHLRAQSAAPFRLPFEGSYPGGHWRVRRGPANAKEGPPVRTAAALDGTGQGTP
jgi:hypothetical protein